MIKVECCYCHKVYKVIEDKSGNVETSHGACSECGQREIAKLMAEVDTRTSAQGRAA